MKRYILVFSFLILPGLLLIGCAEKSKMPEQKKQQAQPAPIPAQQKAAAMKPPVRDEKVHQISPIAARFQEKLNSSKLACRVDYMGELRGLPQWQMTISQKGTEALGAATFTGHKNDIKRIHLLLGPTDDALTPDDRIKLITWMLQSTFPDWKGASRWVKTEAQKALAKDEIHQIEKHGKFLRFVVSENAIVHFVIVDPTYPE